MKRTNHKAPKSSKTLTLAELEIDAKLTRQIAGGVLECSKNKTEN